MAKQGWSPRSAQDNPRIRVLANLGDVNPFDYGGYIVFEAVQKDGDRSIEAEYWDEPESGIAAARYRVYQFTIEPDVALDLDAEWENVARYMGISEHDLLAMAGSSDPLLRAEVYRAVGRYHGWNNLDSSPLRLTRGEVIQRWPELGRRSGGRGR